MISTNKYDKNILMLAYAFPPRGAVGGSIRLIKFLKYMYDFKFPYKPIIITPTDKKVFLNDPHSSESLFSEIPPDFIEIVKTNSFQPLHPGNKNKIVHNNNLKNQTNSKPKNKVSVKSIIKKAYSFIEKNLFIPDYVVLWLPFMVFKAKGEIKKNSIKIVYATAPPFSVLIGAAIVKKITKTKLILDIKDDWIHQNRFKSKNLLLRKIELSLEKFCIKTADKVILVTKSSLNDFSNRYPGFKNKFYLIPNGCDLVEFKKHWSAEEKRNEKFTIIHAGVINAARDPENLFIALKELKDSAIISSFNFQFVFIGPLPNSVTDSIAKLGLNDIIKNIQYLSNISSEYILKLASADLLLAINYPIKTLIPAKLYDYWASRSPIILLDEPDTMAVEFINEYKLGKTSSLNDIEGLKKSILSYFDDWKNNIRKKRQDTTELEKFDRKYLTQKLIEIFQELG